MNMMMPPMPVVNCFHFCIFELSKASVVGIVLTKSKL